MAKNNLLDGLKGGLIVSCQALEDEPLHGSLIMGRMALAAKQGGAVGIRANTPEDIKEIRRNVELPIIGIIKRNYADSEIYITPTLKEVDELIESPCEIIAFDATLRQRPNACTVEQIIRRIQESGKLAMADISTLEEGIRAAQFGADIVATTLSGYTPYSRQAIEPDFELISHLAGKLTVPVFAEGRMKTPGDVVRAFKAGAFSVVVGSAITRPQLITKDFVDAIKEMEKEKSR